MYRSGGIEGFFHGVVESFALHQLRLRSSEVRAVVLLCMPGVVLAVVLALILAAVLVVLVDILSVVNVMLHILMLIEPIDMVLAVLVVNLRRCVEGLSRSLWTGMLSGFVNRFLSYLLITLLRGLLGGLPSTS